MATARLLKHMALWQQDKHAATSVDLTDQVLADVEQLLNVQRGCDKLKKKWVYLICVPFSTPVF